jgi:hypothetical protein
MIHTAGKFIMPCITALIILTVVKHPLIKVIKIISFRVLSGLIGANN